MRPRSTPPCETARPRLPRWCVPWVRGVALLALLVMLLAAPSPQAFGADPVPDPEEARVREQRRMDLLERARAAVRPGDPTAGGMDDIEDVLDQEGPRWEQVAPDAVSRARVLVGVGGESGLVRQGAVLFRWVTMGAGLPHLILRDVDNPTAGSLQVSLDELALLEDAADTGEARAVLLKRLLSADVDVARRSDGQVVVNVAAPPAVVDPSAEPAAPAPPDVDGVPSLRTFAGGYPWPAPPDGAPAPARPAPAPVLQDEMNSPWCRPWLRLRKVQLAERRRVWEAERPSRGLENEDRIRRRQERMESMRLQVKRLEERRSTVLRALDQMVEVEDALVTEGGLRAFEIEDLEASLQASAPPPLPEGAAGSEGAEGSAEDTLPDDVRAQRAADRAKLERRRVEQWVGQQELRLLYITARRASERMAVQDEALVVAREEERIATEAHALFLEELNRIRRERQLGRLQAQAFDLRREQQQATAGAAKGDPAAAAAWQARGRLVAALQEQNSLLRQLVTLRQEVEVLVNTVRPDEAPAATPGAATEAVVDEVDPQIRALTLLAQTSAASLGPKRVALATDYVDVLPPETVASLFAAADERIETLAATERIRQTTVDLAARFDATLAAITSAQAELVQSATQSRADRTLHRAAERRLRRDIAEPNASSFQRAREGIEQQVDVARERGAELRAFRSLLADLGTRSLGIRVERTLTGSALNAAWHDTRWGLKRAAGWLTFQGDDHLGTFVTANWMALVLSLVLVLACLVGVRLARRAIDAWLDKKARTIPALLRVGISPTSESAEAKASRDRLEAERKVVEAAVLEQASGRDAKAAPTGAVAAAQALPPDAPVVPGDVTPPGAGAPR